LKNRSEDANSGPYRTGESINSFFRSKSPRPTAIWWIAISGFLIALISIGGVFIGVAIWGVWMVLNFLAGIPYDRLSSGVQDRTHLVSFAIGALVAILLIVNHVFSKQPES